MGDRSPSAFVSVDLATLLWGLPQMGDDEDPLPQSSGTSQSSQSVEAWIDSVLKVLKRATDSLKHCSTHCMLVCPGSIHQASIPTSPVKVKSILCSYVVKTSAGFIDRSRRFEAGLGRTT